VYCILGCSVMVMQNIWVRFHLYFTSMKSWFQVWLCWLYVDMSED